MSKIKIDGDVLRHTEFLKDQFVKLSAHLREDVARVDDRQAKALFEVSAQVIDGLYKAFTDFERKSEDAFRN